MNKFAIHLLDVGAVDYGDCILCELPGANILIDGGRPSSSRSSSDVVKGEEVSHLPLQVQIKKKLGIEKVSVDLLVVTHCHSDHIGCLPELIQKGDLSVKWALLADPQLGYGISSDSDEPPPFERMGAADKLWLALREEPIYGFSDDELQSFIEDTAKEYERYVGMVNKLQQDLGEKCVLYRGPSEEKSPGLDKLLERFKETGIKIYGPSEDQLLQCAKFLEGRSGDAIDAVLSTVRGDVVNAYKEAISELVSTDAEDTGENGNAVNCQSIVLRFQSDAHKALLTGDMQFVKPQLNDVVRNEVTQLMNDVAVDAPFTFVKLAHHGATNGQNLSFLKKLKSKMLGISTGSRSMKHPTEPTLQALESLGAQDVHWVRVDMNGICSYIAKNGKGGLDPERGELDDLTRPGDRSGDMAPEPRPAIRPAPPIPRAETRIGDGGAYVEVQIRIPNQKTKVSFSIEIDPQGDSIPFESGHSQPLPDAREFRLADGRPLPKLLFVTDPNRLEINVGGDTATKALDAIRVSGQALTIGEASQLLAAVRKRIRNESFEGIVLVGGYDVVPSQIVNTLPRELKQYNVRDRDRLQVWSDDGYGDFDDDNVPELPVSRVPDAHDAALLLGILKSQDPRLLASRAGIRNLKRDFADDIFAALPGTTVLSTCESQTQGIPPYPLSADALYLMLHGIADDGTQFLGESGVSLYPVAVTVQDVPNPAAKVVFTGCCYGALTVGIRARDASPGATVPVRRYRDSIALTCLKNGTNAYIGCTGVHYSPLKPPYDYLGGPMHQLFWSYVLQQNSPARALYQAKVSYAQGIPFRKPPTPEGMAYEYKILRQYTCLGLGW